MFVDTGLEYPELREFVKSVENVTWVRPKMNFKKVIQTYGYPVISKEQSAFIQEYRDTHSKKLKDIRWNGINMVGVKFLKSGDLWLPHLSKSVINVVM